MVFGLKLRKIISYRITLFNKNAPGMFDVIVPMLSSALAIWIIAGFPITEEKAHEVRARLEERRGALNGDPGAVAAG